MTKREAQRIVRRALRNAKCSPETFAARYSTLIWNASARTVRRWADGDTVPHGSVLGSLRMYDFALETNLRDTTEAK